MSPRVAELWGLELVEDAIADAIANAKANEIDNAHFFAGDVRLALRELVEKAGRPDLLVVDPPRSGLSQKVVRRIIEASPARIVYVSCNPTTLAPNAAQLVARRRLRARARPAGRHVPPDAAHRVRRGAGATTPAQPARPGHGGVGSRHGHRHPLRRSAQRAGRPRVRRPPAVRRVRGLLRGRDAAAAGLVLLPPGARGARPRDDDGPVPARHRRPGRSRPGSRRRKQRLRRRGRARRARARAGEARLRADQPARRAPRASSTTTPPSSSCSGSSQSRSRRSRR